MKNRITTLNKDKNFILVFKLDKTTNKKISEGKNKIVQTYSFSLDQLQYVRTCVFKGSKIDPSVFFSLADSVCFDCPFNSYLKCYTHKYMQFSGFISMLKSISREYNTLEQFNTIEEKQSEIIEMCKDKYIRFGTYGEPTLIPIELVSTMVEVSKSHTGYTHQWAKNENYTAYFMASTHNLAQAFQAQRKGFRSFLAVKNQLSEEAAIICPASKEAGFKSTCEKCGLCSGQRKGKKHIQIIEH
jgi:hypothetical protein